MRVVSFFSGAGGMDLGFRNAGFEVVWANEFDRAIQLTYVTNHHPTELDRRSITKIHPSEVPDCDGIIGGPPCQSWSAGGARRGAGDKRGQLFFEFIRMIDAKKPLFFVAENVAGILQQRHRESLERIMRMLGNAGPGYHVSTHLVNAADYSVPQDRKRVFFIGYRKGAIAPFRMPDPHPTRVTLHEAINDLNSPMSQERAERLTHEYFGGGFSPRYFSRNRVRRWSEVSFTIPAVARHVPLHPQAPKMEQVSRDEFRFVPGKEYLYRRLTVRECARIQTFPDNFLFFTSKLEQAYKMIGNAVPVKLAEVIARRIKKDLEEQCF